MGEVMCYTRWPAHGGGSFRPWVSRARGRPGVRRTPGITGPAAARGAAITPDVLEVIDVVVAVRRELDTLWCEGRQHAPKDPVPSCSGLCGGWRSWKGGSSPKTSRGSWIHPAP